MGPVLNSIVAATYGRCIFRSSNGGLGLCYAGCQREDQIMVAEGSFCAPSDHIEHRLGILCMGSVICTFLRAEK